MSEWKEFFEKHQDSNVEIANKGWRGKINIEDLYQAFKARFIDEVEAVETMIGEDGAGMVYMTKATPLKEKEE